MKRINLFADDIIYQYDSIIPRLTNCREYKIIVNIYQTYPMIILITNLKFTFPMKDDHCNPE